MERLLVATDLTQGSRHALGRAIRLAKMTGAALRVIYAPPRSASATSHEVARETIFELVQGLAHEIAGVELNLSIRLRDNDPVQAIIEEAERFDVDLVVLGAQGEPRLRDALYGTTATGLVRSGRPVLVVQNDDARAYAKVLAAVDDDSAVRVLGRAIEIAPAAELFAVHAFKWTLAEQYAERNPELVSADRQAVLERQVAQALTGAGARTSATAHSLAREGAVIGVVTACWNEIEPDLIVMGTHGRSGLARLIHGSFADYFLLQCPSDLLVVPTTSDPDATAPLAEG